MQNVPAYVDVVFILTTFLTVYIFIRAANNNRIMLVVLAGWLALQGFLGYTGFYLQTKNFPPRFVLTMGPALVGIVLLFTTAKGRQFTDKLNLHKLTLLHVIRIPVEIVLLWLFLHKVIPQAMTFEGNNYDILSGITAPVMWYITRKGKNNRLLLLWNVICLCLVLNIVIIAILAAPLPFQQIAFDQPNVAVLYFPYLWLPSCVVPLVLLSHLVAIKQLLTKQHKVAVA